MPPAIDLTAIDIRSMAEAALPNRLARAKANTESARQQLSSRGIDPDPIVGKDFMGAPISVAGFYVALRRIAVTEKAGQSPTFRGARLALKSDLPSRVRETLFVALNQQSAEEAVHGDKVFGATYFEIGGAAAEPYPDEGFGDGTFTQPSDDGVENTARLTDMVSALGGVETLALRQAFPFVVDCCKGWNHPLGDALVRQINETVRPEEARHVMMWRYVFHHAVVPRGDAAVERFYQLTNVGRDLFAAERMSRDEFDRFMKTGAPTPEQLLGRPMPMSA